MSTEARAEAAEFRRDVPWLVLLFAATLWNLTKALGTSPGVWVDTLIENLFVDDCLQRSECTAVGAGATVGIFHSAGYFHWRSLLEWIGWRADGTYHVLQIINALGVVLVALTARRIGGRVAGALAAILMSISIGVPTQLDVISDVVPMPFLGAVFTLVALAAVTNPSAWMFAALGVVTGVTANCYATGLLLGMSGVLIAFLNERNRIRYAVVSAASAAVTTFALSPYTWIVDARILLTRTVGNANPVETHAAYTIPLVVMTGVAVALWIVASVRNSHRRELHTMAAIVLPIFLPLILGSLVGRLDPQPKYLAHALGAACVCIAVALAAGLDWCWQKATERSIAMVPRIAGALDFAAPYLAVLIIGTQFTSLFNPERDADIPPFKYADLAATERYLTKERGWDWTRAARNLKAADEIVRRATIRWVPDWPTGGTDNNAERAYLLKLPSPMVPLPLPRGVSEVLQSEGNSTLVGTTCSWLDWRKFRVCVKNDPMAPETCVDTGLPANADGHSDYDQELPGMPNMRSVGSGRRIMTLRLPLQPRTDCPESWIYMPRQPGICPGLITGIDGSTTGIEEGGRWARLRADEKNGVREVAIQWELGSPGCTVEYRGYPPFFVEGDATTAAFLATVIERQKEFR